MNYLGDFVEDDTVIVMFNTFTSNDPSASSTITDFINTDVHIHKDDGLTQRNNAAGITVSVNFDGITGSHMIKIDTSDDTVAGFWVTGSDYFVRIEGTVVDAATVNAVVGHFSIENRFMRGTDSAALAATALTDVTWTDAKAAFLDHSITTVDTVVDGIQTDLSNATDGLGALKALINTIDGIVDTILADTGELQTNQGNWATATTIALNAQGKLDVNAECDTALTGYDAPTKAEMDTAHGLLATEAKQDTIDGIVDNILTDTGTTLDTLIKDIPTTAEFEARSDVAGTAATPAEVATALTDIHLDHLLAATYDPAAKPGAADALLNEIVENDVGVSRFTANALEEAPSGSGATAAEVRIEIDANSTKLSSIETDTKGISDTAACADAGSPTANSLADIVRKMKWFVANLWEIDENATPDTFKIFKDDNVAVGLSFTVYTDSSKSYRDNTP